MKTQAAIEHFGSRSALGAVLGISRQAIEQWGETVPRRRQWEIELLTDGALRADRSQIPGLSTRQAVER